jgi:RNA polymerase sigma-70 factor (ECF subfamily)
MKNISGQILQDLSDDALIRQITDGNHEAFDILYRRHLPNVFRRVRYVIPENDVEDVTQEVFIAVSKSLGSFRGNSQFGTWLRTLTNYSIAQFYRKRTRKQDPLLAPLSEASGRTQGATPNILEERIFIQSALQKLPENYREVLILRFAEDLQFNEIAELTNLNLEATKSLYRRAISALRNLLEE